MDYCLWGWLKSEVSEPNVNKGSDFTVQILIAIAFIKELEDVLRQAIQDLQKRAKKCIDLIGSFFCIW